MGLKATFKAEKLIATLRALPQELEKLIVQRLAYLGEQCVAHARTLNTYKDQTGNLRNSIGYVIVHNGQVIKTNFTQTINSTGKGSRKGLSRGKDVASQLASELGSGWGLIVVAGMNYALKVESRGLDVLSSAKQLAERELPSLLAELKQGFNQLKA